MAVYVCSASLDERGTAHGGAAGDQTGKEVYRRSWYAGNWSVLLRPRSKEVARKMVTFAEAVCAGNMVGYDQWQRNTLRDAARDAGWDGAKIAVKCETDCSAFVTVCAEAAGVNMDSAYTRLSNGTYNAPVTQTMRAAFLATGAFVAALDRMYLTQPDFLEAGDILVRESGHTVIVVTDGPKATNPTYGTAEPIEYDSPLLFEVATVSSPLYCRSKPSSAGQIVGSFARGEVVSGDAETGAGGDKWIHVTNGSITGWSYKGYLKQVVQTATPKRQEVEVDMDKAQFLEGLTPFEGAIIMDKGAEWRASLPESEWAQGELDDAVEIGITDGTRPRAYATREEVAIMCKRAIKAKEG